MSRKPLAKERIVRLRDNQKLIIRGKNFNIEITEDFYYRLLNLAIETPRQHLRKERITNKFDWGKERRFHCLRFLASGFQVRDTGDPD